MKRRDGFTLIELLTVLGVIGLLATILIPSFAKVLHFARRAACMSNLKQLSAAALDFAQEHEDLLPPHSMESGQAPSRWWGYDQVGRASDTDDTEPEGDIWGYLGREEVYRCPQMASRGWKFNSSRVGYGYNAWFLGWSDGSDATPVAEAGITPDLRCNVSFIRNASELIIFGDSAYRGSGAYGASYAMWYPQANAHVDTRHGEKGCVAFLDGTAKSFRADEVNPPGAPTEGDTPFLRYWDPRQGQ